MNLPNITRNKTEPSYHLFIQSLSEKRSWTLYRKAIVKSIHYWDFQYICSNQSMWSFWPMVMHSEWQLLETINKDFLLDLCVSYRFSTIKTVCKVWTNFTSPMMSKIARLPQISIDLKANYIIRIEWWIFFKVVPTIIVDNLHYIVFIRWSVFSNLNSTPIERKLNCNAKNNSWWNWNWPFVGLSNHQQECLAALFCSVSLISLFLALIIVFSIH